MWYNNSKMSNKRFKDRSIEEVSNKLTNNIPLNIRSYI